MVDPELAEFYQQLHGHPMGEPSNEQDVKDILSCIRAGHGFLDSEDDDQLQRTGSEVFRKKVTLMASKSRNILAQFTKTISNQLYDDPFRFFYELLQNADDAHYLRCKDTPTITFTVSKTELIVDLNEDGFSLLDVLSICSTGQSSKTLDQNSTGEKGFGFKSVFGIADQVHITSGLWSFRFEHRHQDDGIGMISPIWEPGEQLPENVRTRFRLRLSFAELDGLETLCANLRSLHPSVIFALRKIKKLSVCFEVAGTVNRTASFQKSVSAGQNLMLDENIMTIIAREGSKVTEHVYQTFSDSVSSMPPQVGRTQTTSPLTIGLPLTASNDGSPLLSAAGQFVFAFLPIVQITQLPFLVHADFILTGGRQGIVDNAWNRKLRDAIAILFNELVHGLVEEDNKLSYRWLAYIPLQPMIGFWQPLLALMRRMLSEATILFSRDGRLDESSQFRLLTGDFTHQSQPLMSDENQDWSFLSEKYEPSDHQALIALGVSRLGIGEAVDLIVDDLSSEDSRLRTRALHDSWHDTFMTFIQNSLRHANGSLKKRINGMSIMPVRVNNKLEWQRPGSQIFFPDAVNEGIGPDCIRIEIPTNVDIVVLHPDAAAAVKRHEVYLTLGVQHASSAQICAAVTRALAKRGIKFPQDLLKSLELLFWFSYHPSLLSEGLQASTSGGVYLPTAQLFMRSNEQWHAESLVRLDKSPEHRKHFLNQIYQSSKVATRSRGGKTWEQWLTEVAGVRWYPPLRDPLNQQTLHWIFDVVRSRDSKEFLCLLQTYWAQEYRLDCQIFNKADEAVRKSKVLCQSGGNEELQKSWFPTRAVLDAARETGVENRLPILALPDRAGEQLISEWPALRDLGVRYSLDLAFYREALSLLAATAQSPAVGSLRLGLLYKNMADRVTLEDREAVQADFEHQPLIWDPSSNVWRNLDQCVWESPIALHCRFVIASVYDKATVSGLFDIHLQTASVTIECLIEELEYLRDSRGSETNAQLLATASKIYEHLTDMCESTEQRKLVKSSFKEQNLIYNHHSNNWITSRACVWHSSMEINNHVPIAAMYSDLQDFFVGVLGVNTVTSVFMMKELANAAKSRTKTVENIKTLMLAVSELLDMSSSKSEFRSSMEILDECNYLPCRITGGAVEFRSKSQAFFILDNGNYADEFGDLLVMLDFTYEQLNSLHNLIQLLGLDDHYLARHVHSKTSADDSARDDSLTTQFRQCAYAISCCAIAHRSSLFSNQTRVLYNDLANATIQTSSSMTSYLVVMQDEQEVRIPTARPSLIPAHDQNGLSITLPTEQRARKQCMRSQLPGYIAVDLLDIIDSRGEKQIYRIINELESGTDGILLEENIPRISWLPETCRPAPPVQPDDAPISPPSGLANGDIHLPTGPVQTNAEFPANETTEHAVAGYPVRYRQPYRALPAVIQHEIDAPSYWRVIEHVHRQASKIGNELRHRNDGAASMDDLTAGFNTLTLDNNILDPADHPDLFGHDPWLSKFRLGAAGELFVYEVLKHLLSDQFDLPNWQSKIRHLVQAHESYRQVTRWEQPETADIVFSDQDNNLEVQSLSNLSDVFNDWRPEWYEDSDDPRQMPLEWLFEVKTTLGPCETDFYMSPNQYNMLRRLGIQHNSARKQVYCIVRVYNLLSDRVGIRFYIDPWRFREGRLEFDTTEKWKVKPVELD